MPTRRHSLIPLTLALATAPCIACAQLAPAISLSGYATVGVAHADTHEADYLVDAFKPDGPGHTHAWSPDVDSRLGMQATANLTPELSAVLQVLAQQREDGSYRPTVEWANAKYQFTPDFSVRAGRIVLPIFMVTDSRRVGYANPWVRPPVELYSLVPVTSSDGLDASYRISTPALNNTLQVTLGRTDQKFPNAAGFDAGTAKVRNLVAVVDTIEHGAASARLNYGQADLTVDALAPLFSAFRQFGPPGDAIADRYDVHDRNVNFVGVGLSYDPGPWFAMGEWARFDTHSLLGAKDAWYASGGVRVGKFTPYATYARLRAASNTSDPGLPLAGLPPAAAQVAAYLNARLNQQLGLLPEQRTVSVGLRWDALSNVAFKIQVDQVKVGSSSYGTFGNIQPGFAPGSTVRIFSATADMVF